MTGPESRPDNLPTLALHLDRGSEQTLSGQIADQLWAEVLGGALEAGQRLPTVRRLAVDLGVHPTTVERAYDELERRGVLKVRPGGSFVVLSVSQAEARERMARLERACHDALERAEALGFSIDDVMDTLAELRASRRGGEGG